MSRNLIFYVLLIAIFGSLLWFVFNQGAKLEALQSPQTSAGESPRSNERGESSVEASVHEGAIVVFVSKLVPKPGTSAQPALAPNRDYRIIFKVTGLSREQDRPATGDWRDYCRHPARPVRPGPFLARGEQFHISA